MRCDFGSELMCLRRYRYCYDPCTNSFICKETVVVIDDEVFVRAPRLTSHVLLLIHHTCYCSSLTCRSSPRVE